MSVFGLEAYTNSFGFVCVRHDCMLDFSRKDFALNEASLQGPSPRLLSQSVAFIDMYFWFHPCIVGFHDFFIVEHRTVPRTLLHCDD